MTVWTAPAAVLVDDEVASDDAQPVERALVADVGAAVGVRDDVLDLELLPAVEAEGSRGVDRRAACAAATAGRTDGPEAAVVRADAIGAATAPAAMTAPRAPRASPDFRGFTRSSSLCGRLLRGDLGQPVRHYARIGAPRDVFGRGRRSCLAAGGSTVLTQPLPPGGHFGAGAALRRCWSAPGQGTAATRWCRGGAQPAGTLARTQSTISVVVAPGVKTLATPIFSSAGMSSSGMMPPPKTTMSPASRSASSSSTLREQGHVRAGEHREADGVGVLLDGRLDDLLRRLVQAGVDDLHAGVAQRPRDDLGAAVVAVEARLGHDDADGRPWPGFGSWARRQPLPAGRAGHGRTGRGTGRPSEGSMVTHRSPSRNQPPASVGRHAGESAMTSTASRTCRRRRRRLRRRRADARPPVRRPPASLARPGHRGGGLDAASSVRPPVRALAHPTGARRRGGRGRLAGHAPRALPPRSARRAPRPDGPGLPARAPAARCSAGWSSPTSRRPGRRSCWCTAWSTTARSSRCCAAACAAAASAGCSTMNYSLFTGDVRAAAAPARARRSRGSSRRPATSASTSSATAMGGLIARYYVTRLGGDERVHTLVTLGTPAPAAPTAPTPCRTAALPPAAPGQRPDARAGAAGRRLPHPVRLPTGPTSTRWSSPSATRALRPRRPQRAPTSSCTAWGT